MKKKLTLYQKKQIFSIIFILPWMIGFLFFFLKPLLETIVYSFNAITFSNEGGLVFSFIGLDNYIYLFTTYNHPTEGPFLQLMFETVFSTLLELPVIIIFSLLIALLLNQKFRGRGIARTIFFLPIIFGLQMMLNLSVPSDMSNYLSSTIVDTDGYKFFDISWLFSNSGIPPMVSDVLIGFVSRIFNIIAFSGVQILIFLSALQSIDPTLYEVAEVEGATKYESFWKITIPMLFPVIITSVVYTFVDVLYRSELTNVIREMGIDFSGGGSGAGAGSAVATIFLIVTMLILAVILFLLKKISNDNRSTPRLNKKILKGLKK